MRMPSPSFSIPLFLAGLLLAPAALAATPGVPMDLNFQGLLLDMNGDPEKGPVSVDISIFNAPAGGSKIYSEQHPAVAVVDGVFQLLIGTGQGPSGPVDAALFKVTNAYLEITVNGETLTPRQPISSVPYSLRTEEADDSAELGGRTRAQIVAEARSGVVLSGQTTIYMGLDERLEWDETDSRFEVSDQLAVNGSLLVGVTSPTDNNRVYSAFANSSSKLPTSGDMTNSADLFLSNDLEVADAAYLNGLLYMRGNNSTGQDADQTVYFYEANSRTGEMIRWDDSEDGFLISDALSVNGALSVASSSPAIYSRIGSGTPASGAMDQSTDLLVSGDLEVKGAVTSLGKDLFMKSSSPEENQTIHFYDGGSKFGEFIGWNETLDQFDISDDLKVFGTLTKSAGTFEIDHPLDPDRRVLRHSFVESDEYKNVYDGVVRLGRNGESVVTLPAWFEALNERFRYQLTAIGAPMPNLYVAETVADGRFRIAGGAPGGQVSWQVTGVRHDAYVLDHPLVVEEDKPQEERSR